MSYMDKGVEGVEVDVKNDSNINNKVDKVKREQGISMPYRKVRTTLPPQYQVKKHEFYMRDIEFNIILEAINKLNFYENINEGQILSLGSIFAEFVKRGYRSVLKEVQDKHAAKKMN